MRLAVGKYLVPRSINNSLMSEPCSNIIISDTFNMKHFLRVKDMFCLSYLEK